MRNSCSGSPACLAKVIQWVSLTQSGACPVVSAVSAKAEILKRALVAINTLSLFTLLSKVWEVRLLLSPTKL